MKKWLTLLSTFALFGCTTQTVEPAESGEEEGVRTESQATIESSEPQEPEEKRISFIGVGDNLIHENVIWAAETPDGSYDFSNMYENIAADVENADLAFLNQETIFAGPDYPYSGYPSFNTPEQLGTNMVDLGFDLINGATNHTLDFGVAGATYALDFWKQYEDVRYTGVFESEEASLEIPTIERDGVTFSFLAYTYGTNGIEPDTNWRVNYFDEEKIRTDVAKAKEVSDVVIVSAHWGDENTYVVNEYQKYYGQLFADLEVDVVIGTHPHVIQPVEWLTGTNGNEMLVVWSLGNLLAHALDDINTLGGMISFDFVVTEEETAIENIVFRPTVSHFSYHYNDNDRLKRKFKIYYLDEYTDELSIEHGLNALEGISVSLERYYSQVESVIAPEFLPR
ncbi:CapA family protein [Jeotgalibaca porci]|jgi:poly-gamma-glutamate synthesis protein (capsule biosynthesis protein)|uniref:CapA family protein n=1 Tax=Jeotgalibaca porci TaxID=1868793 RepID=UPI00359F7B90